MRRLLPLLTALSLLCGCSSSAPAEPTAPAGGYLLYFRTTQDSASTALSSEAWTPDSQEEDLPRAAVDALLEGPHQDGLTSPFPIGVEVRDLTLKEGVLHLDLSEQYDALSGMSLTLANACFTLTLCQLEGVDALSITVEGTDPVSPSGILYTPEQLLLQGGEDELVEMTAALWFPRSSGEGLGVEYRTLYLTGEASLSRALLEALLTGPTYESLSPVLPQGTALRSVTVEDGVCYVDFNQAFRDGLPSDPEELRLLVYAVVNTMAGNVESIHLVQLLAEGKPLPAQGDLELDAPLAPDPGLEKS